MMRFSFLFLSFLALGACSTAPEIRRSLPQDLLSMREKAHPLAGRTLPFGPLTLAFSIQEAQARAPGLAAAEFSLRAQAERLGVAGRLPNPEFALRTEEIPLGAEGGESDTLVGFRQALPLGGQLGKATALEQERLRSFQIRRDRLALELESRVRGAFAATMALGQAVNLQTERLEIARQLETLQHARVEEGELIPSDLAAIQTRRARLGTALEVLQRKHLAAESELSALVGWGDSPLDLQESMDAVLDLPNLERLLSRLELVPAVAETLSLAQVSRLRADLADARKIPNINLELFYRQMGNGADAFDAAVLFELPWNGKPAAQSRAARLEASSARQLARLELQETRLEIIRRHGKLALAMAQARRHENEILPARAASLETMRLQFQSGEISWTEFLAHQEIFAKAQLDGLNGWMELMTTWAGLRPFLLDL
jgi:outer membrane protein TolC